MKFRPNFSDDEDDKPDYFDGPDVPEQPEEPKKPRLTPDNPDYWDEEESEFAHILPHHPRRHIIWVWLGVAVLAIAACIGFWLRYASPYVEGATQSGYLESIEYRGTVFKTYEGVLLPYKEMHDTTQIYNRDFIFSVTDKEVARTLRGYLDRGVPLRVTYKKYHATLPWRGSSKLVVTDVDSVNPAILLPPENPSESVAGEPED